MGNLRSVTRGLERCGAVVEVTSQAEVIDACDGVVLPGVGAFELAVEKLQGLRRCILEQAESGKPLLGICLGLQLLFQESEEGCGSGLGLLRGRVQRLPEGVKVPHMGWNSVRILKSSPLMRGIEDGEFFYFVHSYYAVPEEDVTVAVSEHGTSFPAVVQKGMVFATQFHPEKSSSAGLRLLENFVEVCR
ncbi:MAG: imidazole glycerol phosphate synthase subunit HisH [Euryarchaeota archaeon]|nr:imidazole glycerol phosphate synthase subunit HisH [Euryarchaeota archaeon]